MTARSVGKLDVEWGSMFSGKSDALISKVKRAVIAKKNVQVFKPLIDDRYSEESVVTHDGREIPCTVVKHSIEVFRNVNPDTDLIAIDEVQFFDKEIIAYINVLRRDYGIDVVVAGLDMWANGKPVPITSHLAAIARNVTKHHAVCVDTGKEAYISYCLVEKEDDVLVGGNDKYIPLSEEAYLERRKK